MTTTKGEFGVLASRRNALVRELYEEFPQVPAGFVADAVLQAWGDPLLPERHGAPVGTSVAEEARRRLLEWERRGEQAIRRVRTVHSPAPAADSRRSA